MVSKKGALELSMNTIVIIVIGVVLLSLGLMFVRGMFGNIEDLSKRAFEGAENSLNQIATHDDKLTIPSQIMVKKDDTTTFNIWVVNEGDAAQTFTLSIQPAANNNAGSNLEIIIPSDQETVDIGGEIGFVIGIEASKNLQKGLYAYNVKVNGGSYASSSFFVKVE